MSEVLIKIREDGTVAVEDDRDGVKGFKEISPDSLLECINRSLLRGSVSSGLLPRGCLSFTSHDSGGRDIYLIHAERRADISYYGTEYKDFPLPRLVFGFRISAEGRVGSCRLGVTENTDNLKPNTPMYHYPLSNVSGFSLCTGNNVLPKCTSLHTLSSLPYLIMAMPNNNDHFKPSHNMPGLEMRDLLELLRDKPPDYYYTNILIPCKATLADFVKGKDS